LNLARAVLSGLQGQYDGAWEAFDQALNAAREYGLVWVEAQVLHERGRIHLARNEATDRAEALLLLDEAASIYQRLQAPRHVEMVLADKIAAQGIESSDIHTSIDRVAAAVQSQHPDLKPHAAPDGTVTIIFSDIEGSTEKTDRLGDKAWMKVLREHNAIVRKQIKAHSGFEVKSEGDGFMLAFQSARKALDCASAIQRALAERNASADELVMVRIGLHAGEVIKEGDDFFGKNVILAARIAGQAKGGEILVSSLLKELTESAGEFTFGEGRNVELKGLSGSQTVFSVAWK
jgi:class 3 adenylate cyclase